MLTATSSSLRMGPSADSDTGLGHVHTHVYIYTHAHAHTCFTAHHSAHHIVSTWPSSCKEMCTLHPGHEGRCAPASAMPTLLPVTTLKQEDETTELRGGVARKKLWRAGSLAVPSWSGTRLYACSWCRAKGMHIQKASPAAGPAQGAGGNRAGPGADPQGLTEFR